MSPVGASIGDDADLDRGQRPIPLGTELHPRGHLVARRRADELLLARELPFHRAADLQRRQHAEIFRDHLLLAAEPTADTLGEDVNVARKQSEQMTELLLSDERRLRAGAHVKPSAVVLPGDRPVRLQVNVLRPRGRVGVFVDDIGRLEALRDVAYFAVNIHVDVAFGLASLLMQDRSARLHGGDRIEHRGQDFVLDLERPAAGFGGRLGLGDDRSDPLADEAHHVVENIAVVGIDQVVLVGGSAVEPARHVLPGEHLDDTWHRHRPSAIDPDDPRMRMGRPQHLEVRHALDGHIHGVASLSGDDRLAEWVRQARPAGLAGRVLLGGADALDGVPDRAIARAAAKIALQRMRQIRALHLVERGDRHDHAGGAKSALKRLRVQKRLLHRMQFAVARESLDRGDFASGGPERRHQAGMHRHSVEPDRACAAIARVAALLDAEGTVIAQERAQALTGLRLGGELLAVDGIVHIPVPGRVALPGRASSARICSAK